MNDLTQAELFQITAYDPPLRDNKDVMEYPFVSIQKGRRKPINYTTEDGRIYIKVTAPEEYGIATIWDWDLMIYLMAHLSDALEQGLNVSPWIVFAPYDALRYMGKGTGGRQYKELVDTLRRLSATDITTSVRLTDTGGEEGKLRWISDYRIPRKYKENEFIRDLDDGEVDFNKPWRVEIPKWIYNPIVAGRKGVLAVHPDYYKLTGGIERWLYRLARKAVPDDKPTPLWTFRMDTLHKRSCSTRELRKFAADVRRIAEKQSLPEYSLTITKDGKHELVTFWLDKSKPRRLPRGVRLRIG